MGLETAAAVTAGTGIYNAFQQDKTNKAAAATDNAFQAQKIATGQGLMNTAPNSFSTDIQSFLKTLNPNAPGVTAPTINPAQINLNGLTSGANLGNDAIMQAITRGGQGQLDPIASKFLQSTVANGGNPYNTSDMFKTLGVTDTRNINQQVNDLIAQSQGGGLGQRFGTSVANKSVNLRTNALNDINTRNAGIDQSSYNTGQSNALTAANSLNSNDLASLQLAISGGSALNSSALQAAGLNLQGLTSNAQFTNSAATSNAGNFLQAAGLNQQQQQALIQSILSGLGTAGSLQANQNGLNASIYQTMFGGPGPSTPAASAVPGAIGQGFNGISQALLLQSLLNSGATPNTASQPGYVNSSNFNIFGNS